MQKAPKYMTIIDTGIKEISRSYNDKRGGMHTFLNVYNPANQTRSEIVDNFVVRLNEFDEIFSALKRPGYTHFIVQGPRGSGKTTLLLRLFYQIQNDTQLSKTHIPIRFDEEQYHIRTLYKLWESVAQYLEDEIDAEFYGIYTEMVEQNEARNYDHICYTLLQKYLKKTNKKLILLIDNFGDMLQKFHAEEREMMRQILSKDSLLYIVGASSVSLECPHPLEIDLINCFNLMYLGGLNLDETKKLLLKLGEHYKIDRVAEIVRISAGRIESLRRLTGGVPRTIVLLFEIFVDNESGDSFKDLEMILDRVTPLYKHRMDDLSPQQQEIVHAIAMNWYSVGVKEIARMTRMESKAVSAQLKLLEMNRIVTKIKTNIKNHYYQLTERFFNIWYLMRYGRRRDKNRVLWLVRFLEDWCSQQDLIERAEQHLSALRRGKMYEKHALFMTEALARTAIPEDLQYMMIQETRRLLSEKNIDLLEQIPKSDRELYKEFTHNYAENNFGTALKNLLEIRNKNNFIQGMIGFLYETYLHDYQKAETFYRSAIQNGNETMLLNLANLYETELGDYRKAEQYYKQSCEAGNVNAMFRLALMYERKLRNSKKAIEYYNYAIKHGHSDSMNNLGLIYQNYERDYDKAQIYYTKAIEKGNLQAMNNLAWLNFIRKQGKRQAMSLLDRAFNESKQITNSYVCSMILLWNNQFDEAINRSKDFIENEEMINNFSKGIQPYLMMLIAKKLYNYTYSLFLENRYNIRDKYKPIYYALLYFMRDSKADEFRRMGSELQQTVEEIIDQITQMQKDYA
jgi:tetratricopeptide (TPR) repeat protein